MTQQNEPNLELPDLHQGLLDAETLHRLFTDIQACTQIIEVTAKFAARAHADQQNLSLDDAHHLLTTGQARGVQLRYLYEGAQWWDTLLRVEGGVRLTRIRHNIPSQ